MPTAHVVVESSPTLSIRARQVCGIFDCPPQDKQRLEWNAALPIEDKPWNIGLIVGPSGCGKSTVARHLWPKEYAYQPRWDGETLIDCFDKRHNVEDISTALNSVGFSTVPAWIRPYHVLSNGERFRAEMAKRMLEQDGVIVIDEFTSVVDRQVATIACNAVQKYVRRNQRQLVAVTCHHDVVDWLQPDWTYEPATQTFAWRSLQQRPTVSCEVARIPYEAWRVFAPYHYMTADLHKGARCFGLWCNGTLAAFGAVLQVVCKADNVKGLSRLVTLPDYQGLGLAFVLSETIGAALTGMGWRYRNYPAHPSFIRAYRKDRWVCCKQPGTFSSTRGTTIMSAKQRPCAVYEYIGPKMDRDDAIRLTQMPVRT